MQVHFGVARGPERSVVRSGVERHDRVTIVERLRTGDATRAHRVERGLGRHERGLHLARDLDLHVLDVADIGSGERRPVDGDRGLGRRVEARAGRRQDAHAAARVAVGKGVGARGRDGLRPRPLLVEHHRGRERGGVGGLLLGALGRVELARVDGEADREE